jgi:hypothetical protein
MYVYVPKPEPASEMTGTSTWGPSLTRCLAASRIQSSYLDKYVFNAEIVYLL